MGAWNPLPVHLGTELGVPNGPVVPNSMTKPPMFQCFVQLEERVTGNQLYNSNHTLFNVFIDLFIYFFLISTKRMHLNVL